jgi:hypothetical protein
MVGCQSAMGVRNGDKKIFLLVYVKKLLHKMAEFQRVNFQKNEKQGVD